MIISCAHSFLLLNFRTEFISYARGIFESNLEDVSSEMPLESDARAYEFLASCNNDVELAKFFLHSTLSYGKGKDLLNFFIITMLFDDVRNEKTSTICV